jgi:muramoyltetrapeptide carboxypeptidase
LAGLAELLDRGVRCVLAARGGYGVTRLLPRIPWQRLVDRRTTFVGFSDLSALINPLAARGGAVQFHGPMVTQLRAGCEASRRLRRILLGEHRHELLFDFDGSHVVVPGRASGVGMGGNLALLASLLGTPFQPEFNGAVLFLEEVNEPAYRLDRLLTQFRCSGIFNDVKAFVSGNLHCCSGVGSQHWRELLLEVAPAGIPIVDGLSFGHGCESLPFPVGAEVTVDTKDGAVSWRG